MRAQAPARAERGRGDPPRRGPWARLVALAFPLVAFLAAALCLWARPAAAEADVVATSGSVMAAAGGTGYEQVTNQSEFFNRYKYLNQVDNGNDKPFSPSDFQVSGGRVVKIGPSQPTNAEGGFFRDVATTSNIWPWLVGWGYDVPGPDGWAFIADGDHENAEGAWVSMTYREVGTLEDAADTAAPGDKGRTVDIKVTYLIKQAALAVNDGTYAAGYNYKGHPVIQFTDEFSYGVFQFGIVNLQTTFEFLDHETGEPLNISSDDGIYFTETSQDKGEGVAVQPNRLLSTAEHPGVWLSGNAPNLKNDANVNDKTRWDAIPGTHLYNGFPGTSAVSGNYVGFVGVPHVYNAGNDNFDGFSMAHPPEYTDAIGDPTYYWRSACYLLRLDKGSSVTVDKLAVGWANWTDSFDLPDPEGWGNGGLAYSTHNFRPLTNPKPKAPHKTITVGQVVNGTNGPDDPVKGVGIGDTVHYEVDQRVHQIGNAGDGLVKYERFAYSDKLPVYVKANLDSVKVIDDLGNPLMASPRRAPTRTDTSGVETRSMQTVAISTEDSRPRIVPTMPPARP